MLETKLNTVISNMDDIIAITNSVEICEETKSLAADILFDIAGIIDIGVVDLFDYEKIFNDEQCNIITLLIRIHMIMHQAKDRCYEFHNCINDIK